MEAPVQAVNLQVNTSGEKVRAVVDEVFLTHGDLLGGDGRHLPADVLVLAYDDGTSDLDSDFKALGLGPDDDDHAPPDAAASTATSGLRATPASNAQLPPLPPRPSRLANEVEQIRRGWGQGMEEAGKENAVERRDNRAGAEHPLGDAAVEGDGVFPLPSLAWDRQSSLLSSVPSSSFSSSRRDSDLDYRDCPLMSELEEIPSYRWLSRSPMPFPESPEVDWGQLVFPVKKSDPLNKITANDWVVVMEEETGGKRCALVLSRGLEIAWRDKSIACWRYDAAAAVLSDVRWLDIRAKVDAADFSPGTAYVCLLVFKLLPEAFGLGLGGETQEAWVSANGNVVSERIVRLQQRARDDRAGVPRRRRDGWLEIELGEFATMAGVFDEGDVVVGMGLREVERLHQPKGGLVVRGVEVRPKDFAAPPPNGEGVVRVSRLPCHEHTAPFSYGQGWILSSWLRWLAFTTIIENLNLGVWDPGRILQDQYADWIPENPVTIRFKSKQRSRFRIPYLYPGFGFRFSRASS